MSRLFLLLLTTLSLIFAAPLSAQNAALTGRIPSVPLVTHDPYFSVCSSGDKWTDAATVHWTGAGQPLVGLKNMATEPQKIEQLQHMTRRPSTPGEVAGGILEETGLTQTELARRIGVSRVTVENFLRREANLAHEVAHRQNTKAQRVFKLSAPLLFVAFSFNGTRVFTETATDFADQF